MTSLDRKTLLERDIKLLEALLVNMCQKELPDAGRTYVINLIERRKNDISRIKD